VSGLDRGFRLLDGGRAVPLDDGDEVEPPTVRGLLHHEVMQVAGQSPDELERRPDLGKKGVARLRRDDEPVDAMHVVSEAPFRCWGRDVAETILVTHGPPPRS